MAAPRTFEEVVATKMREFDDRATGLAHDPAAVGALEDERVAFMVEAVPYIQKYYDQKGKGGEAGAQVATPFSTVVGKTTKRDVLSAFMYHVGDEDFHNEAFKTGSRTDKYTCECGGTRVCDHAAWDMVCTKCGATTRMELDSEVPDGLVSHVQREGLTYVNHMAYKRTNHFSEWLNILQGRENKDIPREVIDAVRGELKKNRVTDRGEITPLRVRQILKKLSLAGYYDNMHRIAHLVGGPPPPSFSPTLEAQLKTMFVRIQSAFDKVKPPGRKNFLSYSYVIYKFCELLGADEYLKNLSLLKSSEKLHAQDEIWKRICETLKWEYIPSGIMTQSNAFHKRITSHSGA